MNEWLENLEGNIMVALLLIVKLEKEYIHFFTFGL